MSRLGHIDLTDMFGNRPARGLYTGGQQTRNADGKLSRSPVRFHGSNEIRNLLNVASSNTISSIETLLCKFEMGDINLTAPAVTAFHRVQRRNSTLPYTFAECDPPASFSSSHPNGIAGPVKVRISFDDGQHWLPATSQFTYLCSRRNYYVPSPIRGACMPCPEGGLCEGDTVVSAKKGFFVKGIKVQKCVNPSACPNGTACAEHYRGPLCEPPPSCLLFMSCLCMCCKRKWSFDPLLQARCAQRDMEETLISRVANVQQIASSGPSSSFTSCCRVWPS